MSDHFVAGTLAGVGGLTIAYPLDTAKIRIQCNPGVYRHGIHCLQMMYKKHGIGSWYKGLLSPVIGYGAINSVVFGVYGSACSMWRARAGDRELRAWETAVCGGIAGAAQSFVRAPVERIKTLCQNSGREGTIRCVTRVVQNEGLVGGLMRGLGATVYREVPQYMLYFPVYHGMLNLLTPTGTTQTPPWASMIAGGTAGTVMWLPPIYSIDVVKSRIQAAPAGAYKGFWDCTLQSYRSFGPRVFIDGISVALMRAFPLHGSIFVIYELVMRYSKSPPDSDVSAAATVSAQ